MSLCVTQGQGNVIVASRGFGDHPCPPSAPGRHSRFSLWDGSEESKPSDDSVQLGAPALQLGAHFADRGVDLVGPHKPRWPVAEDCLDDGDKRAYLGEPGGNGPPDVM